MDKPYLLHMMTAAERVSPFDASMAYDAGWTACIPYPRVTLEEVTGLVRDAVFARGPQGAARTGIFFGGRDIDLATDMLDAARAAMAPPFAVSVLADPSGAFTTAAALVAGAERCLAAGGWAGLAGQRVLVFGGTGPVGAAAAVLAARAGASVSIVGILGPEQTRESARRSGQRHGVDLRWADGRDPSQVLGLMAEADLVFNAATAGVQVLGQREIAAATRLKVACDANAVAPAGIEGVGAKDDGAPLPGSASGALGIGALAVGDLKYRVHRGLLRRMRESGDPLHLDLDRVLESARAHAGQTPHAA